MACNNKDKSIFVIMFIYGICFDYHPYGDKVYTTMVVIPVHIPVKVLKIKSDLLYVSEFTVDTWYPLPPYQCCTYKLTYVNVHTVYTIRVKGACG